MYESPSIVVDRLPPRLDPDRRTTPALVRIPRVRDTAEGWHRAPALDRVVTRETRVA